MGIPEPGAGGRRLECRLVGAELKIDEGGDGVVLGHPWPQSSGVLDWRHRFSELPHEREGPGQLVVRVRNLRGLLDDGAIGGNRGLVLTLLEEPFGEGAHLG